MEKYPCKASGKLQLTGGGREESRSKGRERHTGCFIFIQSDVAKQIFLLFPHPPKSASLGPAFPEGETFCSCPVAPLVKDAPASLGMNPLTACLRSASSDLSRNLVCRVQFQERGFSFSLVSSNTNARKASQRHRTALLLCCV